MLINSDFTAVIARLGVSDTFAEALSEAYQEFSKQIMIELTLFSYEPSKFGFADLDLITREYAIQKHFEPRLETYVRQHLVTSFFEKVLEERGYDVCTPTYTVPEDQYIEGEVFCSNKEFENNAGFEFVIDNETDLIGCRLTDIHSWEAERWFATGMVTKIIIIDWFNIDGVSEDEKKRRTYGMSGNVEILGIREFVSEWLGDAESTAYELFMRKTIQDYQETIGISSLPKLTAPVLFEHRLDEERIVLKNSIKDIRTFAAIEKKDAALPEDQRRDTHYGYRIIDFNNFKTSQEISYSQGVESRSKQLLSTSGVTENYSNRKLYKALVGKGDYAKSFLTSEYLYSQYNESDLFDYTAIVSGYLKSVEQLLTALVFGFADKTYINGNSSLTYRIKSNGKKKPNGSFPASSRKEGTVFKIDLTGNELDFVDTTIGSLIHFLRDYKQHILAVDSASRDTIIDCLECYRIECRNDSFHTHNNYDWEKVEKIRHNTILLYIMLLGGFLLEPDEATVKKQFEIVDNDRLERIYYWLRTMQMYTFRVKLKDDSNYYLATRKAEDSFPVFDTNGLLQEDFAISIRCTRENDKNQEDRWLTISRNNIPEEIWYVTYFDSYPIDYTL